MRNYLPAATVLAAALVLSACGGGGGDPAAGASDGAAAGAPAGASGGMPSNWKATDACTILDKAAVAEVLGRPVPQTSLALVHEPGAADAGTSECTYLGDDGAAVATFMARWSPIGDNTADAIAGAKSTLNATVKAFGKGPVEDVPGMGKAAFIAPATDQLSVYLDDARMFIVSPLKAADGMSGKEASIALARKVGS